PDRSIELGQVVAVPRDVGGRRAEPASDEARVESRRSPPPRPTDRRPVRHAICTYLTVCGSVKRRARNALAHPGIRRCRTAFGVTAPRGTCAAILRRGM